MSHQEVIGALCLQWSDAAFWGPRSDAGFIHHLTVRQSYAGLGRELIAWADQRATEVGREFLCLDCWAGTTGSGATTRSWGSTMSRRSSVLSNIPT